jgi:Uma2 family endonuclease
LVIAIIARHQRGRYTVQQIGSHTTMGDMMATARQAERHTDTEPEFSLQIAELLPAQGDWSEEDYLWLTDSTNRMIEFTNGRIEVLPMPTEHHQAISAYLYMALLTFITRIGGKIFYAPLRVRVKARKFREPDLLLLLSADDPRRHNRFWDGADLVVEIVSPDKPERDSVTKRRDYAQAGIPEYWIVNPQTETITVLKLERAKYAEHGIFARGAAASSVLLSEFTVSVDEVFDAD